MQGDRKTVSIKQACDLLDVSRRTIYNWIASGKVERVRSVGGSSRIFVDTLWRTGNRGVQAAAPHRTLTSRLLGGPP